MRPKPDASKYYTINQDKTKAIEAQKNIREKLGLTECNRIEARKNRGE